MTSKALEVLATVFFVSSYVRKQTVPDDRTSTLSRALVEPYVFGAKDLFFFDKGSKLVSDGAKGLFNRSKSAKVPVYAFHSD